MERRWWWRVGVCVVAFVTTACGTGGLVPGEGVTRPQAAPANLIVTGVGPEGVDGSYAQRTTEEVVAVSPSGDYQQNLTSNSCYDNNPSFYADATKIIYESYCAGHLDIWTMNWDGTGKQKLPIGLAGGKARPEVSPNGEWVAFEVRHKDPQTGESNLDLGVYSVQTGNAYYLTSHPLWERDATWCTDTLLAFTHGQGNGKPVLVDLDIYAAEFIPGNPPRLGPWVNISDMPSGDNADHDPDCDVSGTKIVWHTHRWVDKVVPRASAGEIAWADIATKQVRRVTWAPGNDARPTWSPDGNQIAFTTRRDLIHNPDGSVRQGPYILAVINATNDGTGESGFYEPCCPKVRYTQRKDWAIRAAP